MMGVSTLARPSVVLGALATVAVACSSVTGIIDTSPTPPAPGSPSVAGPESPDQISGVLDFSAPRVGGGAVDGADYTGKDLAIWFWAPW